MNTTESIGPRWSPYIFNLALIISLIIFRYPLRHLINEYRLYRRCQEYPYIIVCKGNSSSERKSHDVVIDIITRVVTFLSRALISLCGMMLKIFLAVLTSAIGENKLVRAELSDDLLASSAKMKEPTMNYTQLSGSSTQQPLHLSKKGLDLDSKVQMIRTTEYIFMAQRQSEDILESSPNIIEKLDVPLKQEQDLMSLELQIEKRSYEKMKVNDLSQSSLAKNHWSSQLGATKSTYFALTQAVDVDSSLSEKMRKRRLGGDHNKVYNMVQGIDIGEASRKRRKLNAGRMPLQGCVTRRQTKGAWQTTKILHRREREEREERLLRAMSRKRPRPSVEKSKYLACTPTLLEEPAILTPALKFGQITTDTSTSSSVSKEQNETSATTSTPGSSFQFGANGKGALLHLPVAVATDGAEKNSESTGKPSVSFSFGNTSTTTINNSTSQTKTEMPKTISSSSAHQYQYKSSSGGANDEYNTKNDSSKQLLPNVGITPSTSTASAAPFLGSNASDSTQLQPTTSSTKPASIVTNTSLTQKEPKISFGATQVSSTQAPSGTSSTALTTLSFEVKAAGAPATSSISGSTALSFGTQPPAVHAVGVTTVAPTNIGVPTLVQPTSASAPSHQLSSQPANPPKTQMPFGNTKENTNPRSFNSTLQTSASSNDFLKPQATNGNLNPPVGINGVFTPSTGNGVAATGMFGVSVRDSAGITPVVATGASARRMARKSRNRRR